MAFSATKSRLFPSATFNPVQWLLRLDAAYREAHKLRHTEDHRLEDMGLTRRDAEPAH